MKFAKNICRVLGKQGITKKDDVHGTFYTVSLPKKPPSSNFARKFSLLHSVIFPQWQHWARFPKSVAVENDSLSPKKIGEGNHWWQCKQRMDISIVLAITNLRWITVANVKVKAARCCAVPLDRNVRSG